MDSEILQLKMLRETTNENPIQSRHFSKIGVSRICRPPDYLTPSAKVYDEYQEYCKQRKERPLDANILGVKLKETGIEKERYRTGGTREYYYIGIKLLLEIRGQNKTLF